MAWWWWCGFDSNNFLKFQFIYQELKSFRLEVEVDERHHTSIIGRRGAEISVIRDKHDVAVQFPERGSDRPNVILIIGFEKSVYEAKEDILKRVRDLVRTREIFSSFSIQNVLVWLVFNSVGIVLPQLL